MALVEGEEKSFNLSTSKFCRGTRARLFQVEEYMKEVEMWFIKYEMSHNKTRRQIYLATDEPQVLMIEDPV